MKLKYSRFLHYFAVLSTGLFLLLQFYDPVVLREYIESKTYDLRLYVKNRVKDPPPPDNIVIVTVDEKSIYEIGRWPWSRAVLADLVEKISTGQPNVIGIDILFSESETGNRAADMRFARVLEKAGNVVLATGFDLNPREVGFARPEVDYLWDHAFMSVISTKEIDWKSWVVKPYSALAPIEDLAMASNLGSVYTQPDRDGVLRWEILYVFYDEDFYASLPLQVARIYMGVSMEDMSLIGGSGIKLGERLIPTDLSGRIIIDYLGREGTFNYVPAVDVIEGRFDAEEFRGKAVLIGTSAIATYDQKVTPLSVNMPGVEKNAAVVENILSEQYIRKSPGIIEMVITLLTAVLLSSLLGRMRAISGMALWVVLVLLYIAISFYLFIYSSLWLTLIYPVFNMSIIFLAMTTGKFFLQEMESRKTKKMFSSYVSPAVVDALINNPELAKLGGQRKEVTVLFSDILGFTSISEKLEPEEVVSMLNEYFKAMTDVIFKWQGTFDKIVGDEIMAFWGAPVEQPNHVELATRCSLDMLRTLLKLQDRWRKEGKPIFDCGIGMNTGEVLVGNIGAEDKKMDYTIIGDHVNAGARVEALTRDYNAKILMTEYTANYLQELIDKKMFGHVELKFRDFVRVKGKEKPLGVYEFIDTELEF
jgi:adenylate cyclase